MHVAEGLRFVVQHHMARKDHYDLRLEWDGVLMSWAVPKGPSFDTHDKRLAVQVEDHPLEYRNFEGTIPKGEYGGGTVMLWDEGLWEPFGNVEDGVRKGELKFTLKGKRLKGSWALVRWKAKSGENKDKWLLLKEKDEYVKDTNGISEFITSIRTGRTMVEIESGEEEKIIRNPFQSTAVELAQLTKQVPVDEDWIYELKYDGYRILAYVEGNRVRLITRNGNDYKDQFYEVASSLIDLAAGRPVILDGEIAVIDSTGKTDFQALQSYFKNPDKKNLTYIIFDILALDGRDLRNEKLLDRKKILEGLMKDAPDNLYYSRYIKGNGKESFMAACEAGMEGIVGKRPDSIYSGTRNGDWIKLKCDKRQEFVIGGYTRSNKKISGISSLLLGVYEDKDLIYAGRAGTGISEHEGKELEEKFEQIKSEVSPFLVPPESKSTEQIIWLNPKLAAEIKFAEWTNENRLRQASFQGLRTDKDPLDIKRERAETEIASQPFDEEMEKTMEAVKGSSLVVEGIKITNPDKILFEEPQITKEDVVRYYEIISKRMLPYAGKRILSAVRCPKGIGQTCFFKKHPGAESKGVVTIPVMSSSGETEEYFYIENLPGLIYEVQMGTLEFHTWGSSIDDIEKPDMMVFDLDPDEGMELDRIRQGVLDMKSILSELSLNSYLKTSGGKGYHVVVPLKPMVSWDSFHDFARGVAEVMERKWPDRYTSNVRKSKRSGRIFIDWIRNGRGATSVAPYSIRARKGARVSMPIEWDELDKVAPNGITMEDAMIRVQGKDPWEGFFGQNQRLK